MLYSVTLHFKGSAPGITFKIMADTATGALIKALAFDWPLEQRKAFLGAKVDPWTKDISI